jgi:hypothetical protein
MLEKVSVDFDIESIFNLIKKRKKHPTWGKFPTKSFTCRFVFFKQNGVYFEFDSGFVYVPCQINIQTEFAVKGDVLKLAIERTSQQLLTNTAAHGNKISPKQIKLALEVDFEVDEPVLKVIASAAGLEAETILLEKAFRKVDSDTEKQTRQTDKKQKNYNPDLYPLSVYTSADQFTASADFLGAVRHAMCFANDENTKYAISNIALEGDSVIATDSVIVKEQQSISFPRFDNPFLLNWGVAAMLPESGICRLATAKDAIETDRAVLGIAFVYDKIPIQILTASSTLKYPKWQNILQRDKEDTKLVNICRISQQDAKALWERFDSLRVDDCKAENDCVVFYYNADKRLCFESDSKTMPNVRLVCSDKSECGSLLTEDKYAFRVCRRRLKLLLTDGELTIDSEMSRKRTMINGEYVNMPPQEDGTIIYDMSYCVLVDAQKAKSAFMVRSYFIRDARVKQGHTETAVYEAYRKAMEVVTEIHFDEQVPVAGTKMSALFAGDGK